jgi:hypothetical protein
LLSPGSLVRRETSLTRPMVSSNSRICILRWWGMRRKSLSAIRPTSFLPSVAERSIVGFRSGAGGAAKTQPALPLADSRSELIGHWGRARRGRGVLRLDRLAHVSGGHRNGLCTQVVAPLSRSAS